MNLIYVENIGQGGFGIVDKVKDKNDIYFAKKTFQINQPSGFAKSLEENVKKRFIREAKLQGAINHKNIVPILHQELSSEPPYFLMPLALNSLFEDISNNLLGDKFMNAIMDILAALEEMHSMKYYHRDLKPANILRFSGMNFDERDFYAIGDFGLMSVNQTNVSSLTQTGMKMGSDYYTAPEIVRDLKNASIQSDIYSLGCILHDFVGTEPRVPCNEIKEKGDFAGILINCTRKDPTRRFKSVTALRDALLSLGDVRVQPNTLKGAEIFNVLSQIENPLSEDDWNKIVNFIEDEYDSEDAIAVLRKLTISHIDQVLIQYPVIGSKLGMMYAKWIRDHSFNFEECDGLSIRLDKFIMSCGIDVQSECLMALLYLGTSHNRWYVEQKFVAHVDKNLDDNLAKRLSVEIRVDENEACSAIRHLENSINYDLGKLHPILFDTIKAICP
jgi:eukaryotic-like serine/threonine-protein kinase